MKVKGIKDSSFVPVDLVITIESQQEAQALYSLFNLVPITEVCEAYDINHNAIRGQIRENVAGIDQSSAAGAYHAFKGKLR